MLFLICFCSVLVFCGIQDAKTMQIPPHYPLLTAACFWLNPSWQKQDSLAGFLLCGGILFLFSCIKQGAFGGGDIKLCAAAGFALGGMSGVFGLLLALLFSIPQAFLAHRKKVAYIAFGPYLAAGFSLAAIFNILSYGGRL